MGAKKEVFVILNVLLIWYHTLNEFSTINPIPLNGPGLLFVVLSSAGREVPGISCSVASHDGVVSLGSVG